MRTIPEMHEHMLKGDEKIENILLPSFLEEEVTKKEKLLYSLPVRMGGLGISDFSEKCKHDYDASKNVSKPLTNLIIQQSKKTTIFDRDIRTQGRSAKKTKTIA